MKPIIFYDMDEVINFFSKKVIEIYNKDFNDNFDWKDNTKYWWQCTKAPQQYFKDLIFNTKNIFLDSEPNIEGIKYMKKLIDEKYETYILTYPQWNDFCPIEKVQFIKKYLPFFDISNLIMTKQKYLIAGPNRVLLDDSYEHLKPWQENGGIAVRFGEYEWTSKWTGNRAITHKDFYEFVKGL